MPFVCLSAILNDRPKIRCVLCSISIFLFGLFTRLAHVMATHLTFRTVDDCSHCNIRGSTIFSGIDFSRELSDSLGSIRITRMHAVPGHTVLYRTEQNPEYVFTIRRGLVRIVDFDLGGAEHSVSILKPSNSLGLESLLGQRYRHHAIVMSATANLCRFSVHDALKLASQYPRVYMSLMAQWHNQLEKSYAVNMSFRSGKTVQRLHALCADIADNRGLFTMPSLDTIASLTDSAKESCSRVIAEMKRQNHLRPTGVPREYRYHGESTIPLHDLNN